jgi:CBS domain-containing protein
MTAADVMLRDPKTLPGGATVEDVRAILANPKVQMVLLADERRFRGAITAIPDSAAPDEPALAYADPNPETISPTETSDVAFERANATPHRRVVVLGEDDQLLGLLCLNAGRTGFCQTG